MTRISLHLRLLDGEDFADHLNEFLTGEKAVDHAGSEELMFSLEITKEYTEITSDPGYYEVQSA